MKKMYGLIGLGMFVFMLAFSLVSAGISDEVNKEINLNQDKLSDTFTLNANGLANFSLDNNSFTLTDGETTLNLDITPQNVDNVTNVTYLVNITNPEKISDFNLFQSDSKEIEFSIVNATNESDTITKTVTITFEKDNFNFCSVLKENREEKTELLKGFSLDVLRGYGDDNEWYPGDKVEVEFEIYRPSYDIEDLEIEWELYNENGEPLSEGDFSIKDIDKRDKETVTFNFIFNENIEDYKDYENAVLYVRLIGEMDDEDYTEFCSWGKEEVKVQIEKYFVITDNVKIDNQKVNFDDYNLLECDSEYSVSFKLWNIGYRDQDDVYVEVYSDSLEIYESFEISEIDAFDHSRVSDFKFQVPENLEDGLYYLNFKVYDDDGDVYENSEDDESKLTVIFKNEESCLIVEPTVTADLYSEAIEGEEMIVKISVRNDDVKSRTFLINSEGYQDWAVMKEISPEAVILDSGAREEITLTLKIKDDIEGEQEFELNIFAEGKLISTQPVQVNVEAKEFLQGIFQDIDWKVLGIILLNIILLVAIIVVAGKILKRK